MNNLDINAINQRYIHTIDKLYRMHGGLSSELMAFHNGVLYIDISVDDRWPLKEKTLKGTALQIAQSWRGNSELKHAFGYHVFICHRIVFEEKAYKNTEAILDTELYKKQFKNMLDLQKRRLKIPVGIVEADFDD